MMKFLNYYDGPLDGIYELDGQKYFFSLNDDSNLYPSPDGPGRVYDLWKIDVLPDEIQLATLGWVPTQPPDGSVTEEELREIAERLMRE